jgi:hypothetical protein
MSQQIDSMMLSSSIAQNAQNTQGEHDQAMNGMGSA